MSGLGWCWEQSSFNARGASERSVQDSNGVGGGFAAHQAAISGLECIADGGPDRAFSRSARDGVTEVLVPVDDAVLVVQPRGGGFGFGERFRVMNARGGQPCHAFGVAGLERLAGIRNQRVLSNVDVSTLNLYLTLKAFLSFWERFNRGFFLAGISLRAE